MAAVELRRSCRKSLSGVSAAHELSRARARHAGGAAGARPQLPLAARTQVISTAAHAERTVSTHNSITRSVRSADAAAIKRPEQAHTSGAHERGYHGTDWVPHDAKMRELGSPGGRTRIETLITLGRKPKLVKNHKLMDGIKRRPQDHPARQVRRAPLRQGPRGTAGLQGRVGRGRENVQTHPQP